MMARLKFKKIGTRSLSLIVFGGREPDIVIVDVVEVNLICPNGTKVVLNALVLPKLSIPFFWLYESFLLCNTHEICKKMAYMQYILSLIHI